jgi:arginase
MMEIDALLVPYDSGHRDTRSGRGPGHFIDKGLTALLASDGHRTTVASVEATTSLPTEIGTTIDVNRQLAAAVRSAVAADRFPLVLAGNCNHCLGAIAGLPHQRLGIVWLDAHGDFNTPETTTSGFLDGMGLAMAAGRCWRALTDTIPGFVPVGANRIVHLGARDLDPAELEMFRQAGIPLLRGTGPDQNAIVPRLDAVLSEMQPHTDRIYLHVDMDIVDTPCGRSSHFAVPGGLPLPVVEMVIGAVKARFPIAGCTLASFNPEFDEKDHVVAAGLAIIRTLLKA